MSKEKRWRAVLSGRADGVVGGGGAMAPPSSRPLHVASSAAPPKARWRFWPFGGSGGANRHRPVREEDLKFLDAVKAAQQVHARPGANAALYLIVVGVAAIALWAATTQVEQITAQTRARLLAAERERMKMQALVDQDAQQVKAGTRLREQRQLDEMGTMRFNLSGGV